MKLAHIPGVILIVSLCLPAASLRPTNPQGVPRPAAGYAIRNPDTPWVAKTMKRLSLRDKVAQLVHVRVSGRFINRESIQFQELADAVRRNHVGGVILFAGNVYESALLLNELQKMSDLPLFVEADFERGASFRITDTTSFPWTMAIGATGSEALSYQQGAVTAREARALGVHWIFAPVMDVNNNPDNPVINIRSYGEDPQLVARLGAAFIRGARDHGVLTTAKHFPGHGDTATDSHIGLAVIPSDQSRLDSVELVPFPECHRRGRGCHHDGTHRGAPGDGGTRHTGNLVIEGPHGPAARDAAVSGTHCHGRAWRWGALPHAIGPDWPRSEPCRRARICCCSLRTRMWRSAR